MAGPHHPVQTIRVDPPRTHARACVHVRACTYSRRPLLRPRRGCARPAFHGPRAQTHARREQRPMFGHAPRTALDKGRFHAALIVRPLQRLPGGPYHAFRAAVTAPSGRPLQRLPGTRQGPAQTQMPAAVTRTGCPDTGAGALTEACSPMPPWGSWPSQSLRVSVSPSQSLRVSVSPSQSLGVSVSPSQSLRGCGRGSSGAGALAQFLQVMMEAALARRRAGSV